MKNEIVIPMSWNWMESGYPLQYSNAEMSST